MVDERRRAHRVAKDLRVVIHFDDDEDVGRSRVADVSLNGIFIRTSSKVEVGTTVFLDLDIGPETIALDGRVVRVSEADDDGSEAGIGVEYTGIGPEARRRLTNLVAST